MWYLYWVSFKLQVHYNKDHYVIVQSLLSNTCDLFSRIFKVFLVESKPHERIDLLITASVNIYQTKKSIPIVMKTFLKEKWWNNLETPLSKRTPLSTNPLSLSNFFMTPLFVRISKTKTPPPPLILGGGEKLWFRFEMMGLKWGWFCLFLPNNNTVAKINIKFLFHSFSCFWERFHKTFCDSSNSSSFLPKIFHFLLQGPKKYCVGYKI